MNVTIPNNFACLLGMLVVPVFFSHAIRSFISASLVKISACGLVVRCKNLVVLKLPSTHP